MSISLFTGGSVSLPSAARYEPEFGNRDHCFMPLKWAGTDLNRRSPRCKRGILTAGRPARWPRHNAPLSWGCRSFRGHNRARGAVADLDGGSVVQFDHQPPGKLGFPDAEERSLPYEQDRIADADSRVRVPNPGNKEIAQQRHLGGDLYLKNPG
jgi:hypothetical protein